MTILRTQQEVTESTPMADLLETYNALTGKSIKKFESRAVAQQRVKMAILAAEDAAGKAGVRKGEKPRAATVAELADKAAGKTTEPRSPMTDMASSLTNPYPAGSLSAQLRDKANKALPIGERKSSPRVKFTRVVPTFAGESKPNPKSDRARVLEFIQQHKAGVDVAAIERHFGMPCRGFLQKLAEKNHIKAVEAQAK